jgi:hypothetical protein
LRYFAIMLVAVIPSRLLFERLKLTKLQSSVSAGMRALRPWLPILLSEIFRMDKILLV